MGATVNTEIHMMSQNIKHKINKDLDSMVTDKALNIAQGIKQEKQTKAQTKLVAQGIGKGIELYKKQQNKKQRDIDKNKKKELKNKSNSESNNIGKSNQSQKKTSISQANIAWGLLLLSWLFFLVYIFK
ncbi:MAG TPA: DUF2956 family protein [Gallionellaceae bacterium]|nr:DUF2956 family protein [Gallionellaceae bacterium]